MQKFLMLCSCVPLLVLLLLLQGTMPVDAGKRSLACPQLSASRVCAIDGAVGLAYSDGCNRISCHDNGEWRSTRRSCPQPDSPAGQRQCQAAARDVLLNRLGPFACANVQPADVCANRPAEFHFSDGCNGVSCDGAGNVASSTMRACPAGDPAGAYCQFVADSIGGSDDSGSASGDRRRRGQQEYACPDLAASVICKRSTNGLSYSDGCNSITCHGNGLGQSTMKFCPAPEASDQAGRAYCQQAERAMRAKMERASLRSRCLTPEAVCQGPNVRQISYNDGCNRCRCMAAGDSACTRRGCNDVLMTDEEFADYCKERGAGLH